MDTHPPESCHERWCKTHWYFDFPTKRHRRYPQLAYYEIGPPIDGKKQWSGSIPVFCGPPAYKPSKPEKEEKEKVMPGYKGISTDLYTYVQERANRVVTIQEMEKYFEGKYDHRQILANMANLMKTKAGKQIEKLQIGMWRFVPTDKPSENGSVSVSNSKPEPKQLFEMIRELNDGYLIIGEDGELYRAKRLKF